MAIALSTQQLQTAGDYVERGRSAVECRTRNQGSLGLISSFATVSKFGRFLSLHNTPVHSAVPGYR